MMPIKIPMSWTRFVLSLSQRVAIINENSGVVPFRTDIVPAFKFRAACEKRKKGIEALIQAKSIRGRKSFLRFFRLSKRTKMGVIINDAISNRENTNVIGPTSGAATFINRKEAPHATPIAKINDQSMTEFLSILLRYES